MVLFYVGIDVAKARHQVAFIDAAGAPHGKSFSISNDAASLAALFPKLGELGAPEDVSIGMEATGSYGWALQYHLSTRGYRVSVLNPLQTGAFAKTRIRKTKTDPIDAQGIAQLIRFGKFAAAIIPNERALRLRELARYRIVVVHLLNRFTNLLESRVSRTFPEFGEHFKELWFPTSLGILRKHPLAADVAALPVEHLARELKILSFGRIKMEKAQALQQSARTTIGIPLAGDVYAFEIRGIAGVIRMLQTHIRSVTRRITEILHEVPQVLTTIPGIGDLLAATILGELVDIRLFERPEKLVAFAGFDPATFNTGQFVAEHGSISKRGSTHLRRAFWQAAFIGIRFCPDLKAYYDRKRTQGKYHKVALGATSRKLIHLAWRLMTDNRPYEDRTVVTTPKVSEGPK